MTEYPAIDERWMALMQSHGIRGWMTAQRCADDLWDDGWTMQDFDAGDESREILAPFVRRARSSW